MLRERNIRLLVEYDGTSFAGWQIQRGQPTLQGALQEALRRVTGETPTLVVAGRTDAGVHAVGQVANFKITSHLDAQRFAPALNATTPAAITVHQAVEVALSFNAQRDAIAKRYRYRVYQGPQRAALAENRAWHVIRQLDLDAMRRAAQLLLGELDFEAFRSVHCDARHAKRHMFDIAIDASPRPPVGQQVDIVFCANAYCRHMCRILAGTLVEVGRGQRDALDVARVLASRDRTQAGVTAPAGGLTLLEVAYPQDLPNPSPLTAIVCRARSAQGPPL